MSEMVRRVAKIVRDFADQESASAYIHPVYLRVATDILAAMREPVDAMLSADGNFSAAYKAAIWREMIDAILREH